MRIKSIVIPGKIFDHATPIEKREFYDAVGTAIIRVTDPRYKSFDEMGKMSITDRDNLIKKHYLKADDELQEFEYITR